MKKEINPGANRTIRAAWHNTVSWSHSFEDSSMNYTIYVTPQLRRKLRRRGVSEADIDEAEQRLAKSNFTVSCNTRHGSFFSETPPLGRITEGKFFAVVHDGEWII